MDSQRHRSLEGVILALVVLFAGVLVGMLLAGSFWPSAAPTSPTEAPRESSAPISVPAPSAPEIEPVPAPVDLEAVDPDWLPGDGTRMVSISVADERSCGVWDDGTIDCWGNDSWGSSTLPSGLLLREISVGDYHACGIAVDGATHCWGELEGRPVLAPSAPLRSVRAEGKQQCGLTMPGSIICWGIDATPHRTITGQFDAFDVGLHGAICALDGEGRLSCDWDSPHPYALPGGERFTQVSVGETQACGVTVEGAIRCLSGQRYRERERWQQDTFDGVPFLQVEMGTNGGCALRGDLTLACFGTYAAAGARPVSDKLLLLDVGLRHACGISAEGKPVCWGSNSRGQARPPRR